MESTHSISSGKRLVINPTKTIFYAIFFLAFCLSGVLTMLDLVPYRMGVTSLLILPLFLLYGVRVDRIFILYLLLVLTIFLSGWFNQTPLSSILLFSRTIVFSYLIYYLVENYVTKKNIVTIIRICVIIGLIQLPVLVFQLLTYERLPSHITVGMNLLPVDYTFGTFNFKGDYSMTFFLTLLVILLLFSKKQIYFIPYRFLVALWLTLTVLMADSDIAKSIVMMVWVFYFLSHLNRRIGIYLLVTAITILGVLLASGLWDKIGAALYAKLLAEGQNILYGNTVDIYLSGGYARGSAIHYYLTNEILWLGDGPSRYMDPVTRSFIRGNYGHIFSFYSEVGLIGWLLSMLIFFQIAFKPVKGFIHLNWVTLLMFVAVCILSFTSQIMNDISLVLIYCIIAKTYLIQKKQIVTQSLLNSYQQGDNS